MFLYGFMELFSHYGCYSIHKLGLPEYGHVRLVYMKHFSP